MKLQYGHAPLYTRGDDANSKQFTSLHAVQRHMVDVGRCKMAFEDNEEEYEEFYDWAPLAAELEGGSCTFPASLEPFPVTTSQLGHCRLRRTESRRGWEGQSGSILLIGPRNVCGRAGECLSHRPHSLTP